jgi:hypothetical protein
MVQGWYFARAADAESTEELLVHGFGASDGKVIAFPA